MKYNSEFVNHFPEEIPTDASNVEMYYLPGFLQGGTVFELKLKLAPSEVEEVMKQFEGLGIKEVAVDKYGALTDELLRQARDIQTPNLSTTSSSEPQMITLGAEPRGSRADFIWNHGVMYGVGVDVTNSEVIYWVEDW